MKKQNLILENARKFAGLCPYKELNENRYEFHAENGTVFLKWNWGNITIAANIGAKRFSAAIVDTIQMKPVEGVDGLIEDEAVIKKFFFSVGTYLGYARTTYCVSCTGSTGYYSFNEPIVLGLPNP